MPNVAMFLALIASQVTDKVQFSLGIYSGREDPAWKAGADDIKEFTAKFNALKVQDPQVTLNATLGYHGFLVNGFRSYDRIWVFKGTVEATRDGKTYQWKDEDRALEKYLLKNCKDHVSDGEYKMAASGVEGK